MPLKQPTLRGSRLPLQPCAFFVLSWRRLPGPVPKGQFSSGLSSEFFSFYTLSLRGFAQSTGLHLPWRRALPPPQPPLPGLSAWMAHWCVTSPRGPADLDYPPPIVLSCFTSVNDISHPSDPVKSLEDTLDSLLPFTPMSSPSPTPVACFNPPALSPLPAPIQATIFDPLPAALRLVTQPVFFVKPRLPITNRPIQSRSPVTLLPHHLAPPCRLPNLAWIP